jgi:uncharacterized protein YecA (UPF0149 family)
MRRRPTLSFSSTITPPEEHERAPHRVDRLVGPKLDFDGLLGVLHAVAVAPGIVPVPAWLDLVLAEPWDKAGRAQGQRDFDFVMTHHDAVLSNVAFGIAVTPDPGDVAACKSFARGYVSAAELCPEWVGDDERWGLACWAAYLAGRLDRVPASFVEKMAALGDEAASVLRHDIPARVLDAQESFFEARRATVAMTQRPRAVREPRLGRNERCPCGSGRKVKRCHLAS